MSVSLLNVVTTLEKRGWSAARGSGGATEVDNELFETWTAVGRCGYRVLVRLETRGHG